VTPAVATRPLPRTGVELSEFCLGTLRFLAAQDGDAACDAGRLRSEIEGRLRSLGTDHLAVR
jgi:hypothetical protein